MALHTDQVTVTLDGDGKGFEPIAVGAAPATVITPALAGTWPPAEGWPAWPDGSPISAAQARQDVGGLYGPAGEWVVIVQVLGGTPSSTIDVRATWSS